jgi:ribosomal subunit interface protein
MPVNITPHDLILSPALIAKVENEIESLKHLAGDVERVDVVLRHNHGRALGKNLFIASARLSLPSGDIHASASHSNLSKAISKVGKRLARRLY